jgi:hypothetical protein
MEIVPGEDLREAATTNPSNSNPPSHELNKHILHHLFVFSPIDSIALGLPDGNENEETGKIIPKVA